MRIVLLLFILSSSIAIGAQENIIDERTGVKIIFSSEGTIFPDGWYSKPTDAKAITLKNEQIARSKTIVIKALNKYPISVIQKNLKNIYILHRIEFFNQSFGGTNSNDSVFLTNRGIGRGYTNFYLEQLFHAEFSSILLRNNSKEFKKDKWLKTNPVNFNYGKGGVEALKSNTDSEYFDIKFNNSGFINEYATSSMENDFNSFAKNLFLPKQGFSELIEDFSRLKRKKVIIIDFYNEIDTFFTSKYFNDIDKSQ